MQKYNYVMALLSLWACARSATHSMIKAHMTRAHDLHYMNKTHDMTFSFVDKGHVTIEQIRSIRGSNPAKILWWSADFEPILHSSGGDPANLTRS